jgi:hypothetical protein
VPVTGLHCTPAGQQVEQPHSVAQAAQRFTQVPPTHCWPHPQAGLQVRGWQTPPTQNSAPGHAPLLQWPPQPSGAPHAAPLHCGWQRQLPPWQNSPDGQLPLLQVPPQPSGAPQVAPLQLGVQHMLFDGSQFWLDGQPQMRPQPSGWPHSPA